MSIWDNYECDGQMSLNDWLSDRDKVREVGMIGLCDDPTCSNCGYEFRLFEDNRYNLKSEIDIDRCPKCKVRLDWRRWHRCNDDEVAQNQKRGVRNGSISEARKSNAIRNV